MSRPLGRARAGARAGLLALALALTASPPAGGEEAPEPAGGAAAAASDAPDAAAASDAPDAAAAGDPAEAPLAVRFSQYLFGGSEPPPLAPALAGELGPEELAAVRERVFASKGRPLGLGEPRLESEAEGLRSYRVLVSFAHGLVDLRVIVDAEDRVAGFEIVPFEDPPRGGAPGAEATEPRAP